MVFLFFRGSSFFKFFSEFLFFFVGSGFYFVSFKVSFKVRGCVFLRIRKLWFGEGRGLVLDRVGKLFFMWLWDFFMVFVFYFESWLWKVKK